MFFFFNEYDLLVLEIGLSKDLSRESTVEIKLQFWNEGKVEQVHDWTQPAAAFGLKDALSRSDSRHKNRLLVPSNFGAQLSSVIRERFPDSDTKPLWLKFRRPAGYLGLVKWEQLADEISRPMYRLPEYFVPKPVQSSSLLSIAICASMPLAKSSFPIQAYLLDTIKCLKKNIGRSTEFHIFVDDKIYRAIRRDTVIKSADSIRIYPPSNADEFGQAHSTKSISTPVELSNPWLQWMQYELRDVSIDAVCFVSHGYFADDRGAIALAQTPTVNSDRNWARFVGSQELSTFMTLTGAWSVLLLSPQDNFSEIGLYSLADELAKLRPGTFLLHDFSHDHKLAALSDAARFAFNRETPADDNVRLGSVIYAPPYRVDSAQKGVANYPKTIKAQLEAALDTHEIQSAIQETDSVPSWAVNAERYLEKQTAQKHVKGISESKSSRNTIQQIRDIIHVHSIKKLDEGSN